MAIDHAVSSIEEARVDVLNISLSPEYRYIYLQQAGKMPGVGMVWPPQKPGGRSQAGRSEVLPWRKRRYAACGFLRGPTACTRFVRRNFALTSRGKQRAFIPKFVWFRIPAKAKAVLQTLVFI